MATAKSVFDCQQSFNGSFVRGWTCMLPSLLTTYVQPSEVVCVVASIQKVIEESSK